MKLFCTGASAGAIWADCWSTAPGNESIDHYPPDAPPQTEPASPEPDAATQTVKKEEAQLVFQAVQAVLSEEEQCIINLWRECYKEREIALIMGLKDNTAATKIRRAEAKILAYVKENA